MRTLSSSKQPLRPLTLAQWFVSAAALAVVTGPANAADPPLAIINFLHSGPGSTVLRWTAETNAFTNLFFTVEGTTTFATNFAALSGPVPETALLAFTDTVLSSSQKAFYRVVAPPAYTALNQPGAFAAYAATNVGGLNTAGYSGAIFDGRYVYFVPFQNGGYHGRVLRYDTQGCFTNLGSWAAYDAATTGAGEAVGYTGGVFDGRYVYFSPQDNATAAHGRVLRFDTQSAFTNAASWALYDAGATGGLDTTGFQGAIFDGRFVYFVPHYNNTPPFWNGIVVRYDTHGSFTNAASWQAYDAGNTGGLPAKGYSSGVFDGRFVYFAPTFNGAPSGIALRYDSQGPFTNSASWQAYDASGTGGQGAVDYKGALFDGRYVYFLPNLTTTTAMLRYDTQGGFTNSGSWAAYSATNTSGLPTQGYDGGVFDGRYVCLVPYHDNNSVWHGLVMRYDTRGGFTNSASWQAADAGGISGLATQGYVGAVSDGRYIYFAPYYNTNDFSGNVLRFDARLPRAIPPTVTGGSNL